MAEAQSRVQVCHRPPDNPDNYRTITIGASAVPDHLAHGDLLGACATQCPALCNDSNACTTDTGVWNTATEHCTCSNTPVVCAASDQCHVAGTCDPATGQCSDPAAPDGTTCNDADACTQTDVCRAGVCVGSVNACACEPGYEFDVVSAPPVCVDIDECAHGTHDCRQPAYCTNEPGGFTCCDARTFPRVHLGGLTPTGQPVWTQVATFRVSLDFSTPKEEWRANVRIDLDEPAEFESFYISAHDAGDFMFDQGCGRRCIQMTCASGYLVFWDGSENDIGENAFHLDPFTGTTWSVSIPLIPPVRCSVNFTSFTDYTYYYCSNELAAPYFYAEIQLRLRQGGPITLHFPEAIPWDGGFKMNLGPAATCCCDFSALPFSTARRGTCTP